MTLTPAEQATRRRSSLPSNQSLYEEVAAGLEHGRRDSKLLDGRDFVAETWDRADTALRELLEHADASRLISIAQQKEIFLLREQLRKAKEATT